MLSNFSSMLRVLSQNKTVSASGFCVLVFGEGHFYTYPLTHCMELKMYSIDNTICAGKIHKNDGRGFIYLENVCSRTYLRFCSTWLEKV